ncbi:E3 ubiquitin-protein ligase MARCHF7-like [Bombina bombina]|uniref:E3 ubiquitin-protein ligase MARCHF7-like n=1 Tax=Bombina bombina TaxID=8345 RepID=UPI00235AB6AB|nr:E3 ubiquitin-protein ligase MARCHF7-like [Bombina bombina]
MATKKQHFIGGLGFGKEALNTPNKLPAINKDPNIIRKKSASTLKSITVLQPQETMLAVKSQIMVQKKRLHTRYHPDKLVNKDGERGQRRVETLSMGQAKADVHQNLTIKYRQQARFTSSDTIRNQQRGPLTPVFPLTENQCPSSLHNLDGYSQLNRTSPIRSIDDCFNVLLERNIEENVENDVDTLDIMSGEDLQLGLEPHLSNFEQHSSCWGRNMNSSSSSELENNMNELVRETEPHNVSSVQTKDLEFFHGDSEEENNREREFGIQFQNNETYINSYDDIGNDNISISNREDISIFTTPNIMSSSESQIEMRSESPDDLTLNYSLACSLSSLDENEDDRADMVSMAIEGEDTVSLSTSLNMSITPCSQNLQNNDLTTSISSVEDRGHSIPIQGPSYLSHLENSLSPTAPNPQILSENLHLAFVTLSMRRNPGHRHSGRIRTTQHSSDSEKTKADPEKLKKLQNSLLEEESEDEEGDICRICLMGGETTKNHLIAPCQCTGSLKYVHQDCIKKWLEAKITSGAGFDVVKTCEMCKQNVNPIIEGFNVNELYRKHQETQVSVVDPSLYLVLLLHLYQQRYEELLRLTHTRSRVTEISRHFSHLRTRRNENPEETTQDSDSQNSSQIN